MRKVWFSSLSAVNKKGRAGLLLALLFGSPLSFAEEVVHDVTLLPEISIHAIQKNANKDVYQLGDRIPVYAEINPEISQGQTTFEIKLPEGASSLEDQGWYLDPNLQILSGNLRFVVSPIQSGKLILPMLLILNEDKTPIARTSPFTVQVSPVQARKEPLQLVEIVPIALPTRYWILFGVLGLAIALLLALGIRRMLKRKKPIEIPPIRIEPDHLLALRDLDQLYQKHTFKEDNLKPVAFGVSDVLKTYFSRRFQIDANEATTDEMLTFLKRETLGEEGLKEIAALFQELDLVKFTKITYGAADAEKWYYEFKIKAQVIIQRWGGHS